jgi:hypothetical protein
VIVLLGNYLYGRLGAGEAAIVRPYQLRNTGLKDRVELGQQRLRRQEKTTKEAVR